ncbi:acetyl-CoA carboxylase biotin carboxylase subunit [Bacillaceae bacterium S4-13-56]
MFDKVLIANRGEIASRIIKTCKRLGIHTVVIFSEADTEMPFVKEADDAFLIGTSRVQDSYLKMDAIIDLAKQEKVDAIHPGYGLLSENADFAKKCTEAGVTFIGPTSEVIRTMGSKIEARKTMEAAGLPVIPGIFHGIKDENEAVLAAQSIGYPVMIKASAGGGGIGMETVYSNEELKKAFESNQRRSTAFFGDGTMYMEKKLENARHIEVQILADRYGNVIHLFDRECSIQRRHQKILEEAPSPFLTEKTRERMAEAAVIAAQNIGYQNAGTIEFLVDSEQNFYFLEMNTRLQVEHPVTEFITGLDLVEEQLRIAAGEELRYRQGDLRIKGHSIEVRVYAEDPITFYPSPGLITKLSFSKDSRVDTGVQEGAKVTPYYDPMIAKVIVHGSNRSQAIEKLNSALNYTVVEGIKTNLPLLKVIGKHEKFKQGSTWTTYLQDYQITSLVKERMDISHG